MYPSNKINMHPSTQASERTTLPANNETYPDPRSTFRYVNQSLRFTFRLTFRFSDYRTSTHANRAATYRICCCKRWRKPSEDSSPLSPTARNCRKRPPVGVFVRAATKHLRRQVTALKTVATPGNTGKGPLPAPPDRTYNDTQKRRLPTRAGNASRRKRIKTDNDACGKVLFRSGNNPDERRATA